MLSSQKVKETELILILLELCRSEFTTKSGSLENFKICEYSSQFLGFKTFNSISTIE